MIILFKRLVRFVLGNVFFLRFHEYQVSRSLQKYGYEVLSIVDTVFNKNGIDYWLIFGTLLGAYRESGFIKHDDDIDIGVYTKDISVSLIHKLEQNGFIFISVKETNDHRHRMMSFQYHGITVDFYGFVKDSNNIIGFSSVPLNGMTWKDSYNINRFGVCLVSYPDEGLQRIPMGKQFVPIPKNVVYVLKGLYGESFMTPQKNNKGIFNSIARIEPQDEVFASIVSRDELAKLSND